MAMHRSEKEVVVSELQRKLGDASAFYLTDFTGLNVKQITQFRARLRKQGVEYIVVKNTLAKRALEGLELPNVEGFFSGPTGLVIGREDAVAAAKVLADFAREFGDRPAIKVGVVAMREFAPEQVKQLADMPPREVLLSHVSRGLRAPLARLLGGMSEVLAHAARAFALLQEQREREEGEPDGKRNPPVALASMSTASPARAATATPTTIDATAAPEEFVLIPGADASLAIIPQEIDEMIAEEIDAVEEWTLGIALRKHNNSVDALRVGVPYRLALAFGPASPAPTNRITKPRHTPARLSISSTLMLVSNSVELLENAPDSFEVTQSNDLVQFWRATAKVELSADSPLEVPEITIVPRSSSDPQLNVLLIVGDQLYRDWVLHLRVLH